MNRVTDVLGIDHPVIQGAMAGLSGSELVAAVSEAGGLGTLQTALIDEEGFREEINKIQEITSKPFSVNFPIARGDQIENLLKIALDEGVEIFSLSAGDPRPYMDLLEEAKVCMQVIPFANLASRMEDLGFDLVVAEGKESGGDISMEGVSTFSLVPSVVDKVDIPVIAAGGIADERTAAATKKLGAEGVQMGTRFMVSKECGIRKEIKDLIVESEEDEVVSLSHGNMGLNAIKNRFVTDFLENSDPGDHLGMVERLERQEKGMGEGKVEEGLIIAGRSAGLVDKIESVKKIVEEIGEAFLDA